MASDSEIISRYPNLLIAQYKQKPKAFATIRDLVTPVVMNQLPLKVQKSYNIDPDLGPTAEGVQLDIIGKYVGASRNGFDFSGAVTLTDAQYLVYIQIMIARNKLAADQYSIQEFIHTYFDGVIQEFDNQTMGINYFYLVPFGENLLAEFFIRAGQLPKPLGVAMAFLTYAQPVNNFFGMQSTKYTILNIAPFNTTVDYQSGRPWLNASYGIIV